MNRSPRLFVIAAMLVGGLLLAGCETTGNAPEDRTNLTSPTTAPSPQGNSANGTKSPGMDNSEIGNGAFGESPP